MMLRTLLFTFLITVYYTVAAQDTITVMIYNSLKYPQSNASKADTLKPIIGFIKPDVFMINELTSGSGAATILNSALNINGVTSYQKANYTDGPDTDNMLFYNSDKLALYSQYEIPTTLRNISEYVLYYKAPGMTAQSDTVFIYCYMAHLKASTGSINEQQRNQEAVALKNYMDSRPNIENIILGGDFNLYTSAEAAHNTILNGGNVTLLDPINSPGSWTSNSFFANIHTQSTRFNSIGDGGAFGGLDDRFDFIFYNNDLPTGAKGLTYVPNSYTAVGNDGNHYNKAINDFPTNVSAPANVIDALYYFSDHLPVTLKAYVDASVGINQLNTKIDWSGYVANNYFYFSSNQLEIEINISVYDVLGILKKQADYKGLNKVTMNLSELNSGIYFIKVYNGTTQHTYKVLKQ